VRATEKIAEKAKQVSHRKAENDQGNRRGGESPIGRSSPKKTTGPKTKKHQAKRKRRGGGLVKMEITLVWSKH